MEAQQEIYVIFISIKIKIDIKSSMDLLTILTFITILLSQPITPLKIFLLGGDVTYLQPDVYIAMANATGKIAQPNNCSQDWQATTCPRVAVVTSAAQN